MRAAQRLALLERATRRLAFARSVLMDGQEVRRILDLLQGCVDAERDGNGMLSRRDIQHAIHRAYTRLEAGLDPASSGHAMVERAAAGQQPDPLTGTALDGIPLHAGLWYAAGPTTALHGPAVQQAWLPGLAVGNLPQQVHVLGLAEPASACYGLCIGAVRTTSTDSWIPLLAVDGQRRLLEGLESLYPSGHTFHLP